MGAMDPLTSEIHSRENIVPFFTVYKLDCARQKSFLSYCVGGYSTRVFCKIYRSTRIIFRIAGSFSARVSRAIRARTAAWDRSARGPTCAKMAEHAGKGSIYVLCFIQNLKILLLNLVVFLQQQ